MLNQIETSFRKLRRVVSRSEWLVRLLHLTKTQGTASEPGLILIQIDGLSRRQMELAMAKGRLPFLARLLRAHKYRLHSLYSGLPSSTPAVTAELLYGVKCAVPAFSFYDRSQQSIVRMFEPSAAKDMDERLQGQSPPLLAGGSAYASIYTGGAAETHFCASVMGLSDLFRARYPLRLFIILLFSVYSLLRVAVLLVIEFFLALLDLVRGLIAGQDLWKEIKFIPSRVGVSILMRELATIGAMIDATRGLPVIYLDLVGYDEQSHRRGPTSRFAHWSLKGIDDAIGRIWKAARRSAQRDYDVWVFSDHGSEDAIPYPLKHGRSLQEAVAEVFGGTGKGTPLGAQRPFGAGRKEALGSPESLVAERDTTGIQSKRMRSYMLHKPSLESHAAIGPQEPVIAAMGPVGHVYVDQPLEDSQRKRLAQALVEQARIPMVSVAEGPDGARVWTKRGQFVLPEDAPLVFTREHPFLEEMTQDFIALCRHQNAGDFVLWGWSPDEQYVTFPVENGSHAGPGFEETHAFALLPEDAPLRGEGVPPLRVAGILPAIRGRDALATKEQGQDALATKGYLRPLDLRDAALRHLGRHADRLLAFPSAITRDGTFRVMTYNVHSCVGIDGKLSPRRVARVISRYEPDIVALQEVDVGRTKTRQADQARVIAEYLRMDYHFNPTIQIEEEAYGDCILSRLPLHLVKAGKLPSLRQGDAREPRGALWVAVQLDGRTIHFVNTHLGLNARERLRQIHALLGRQWLGGLGPSDPIVLCGDFNASPRSRVWRLCREKFSDVQVEFAHRCPRCTWCGHYPFVRIDHIFVNPRIRVVHVDVGNDYLARIASDHRPLLAELSV